MDDILEVGCGRTYSSLSGRYELSVSRYNSRSHLLNPRDYRYLDSNLSVYVYVSDEDEHYMINAPYRMSNLSPFFELAGLEITGDVYYDLMVFWEFARVSLSNFEVHALVYDSNEVDSSKKKLVSMRVNRSIDCIGDRVVVGYIFPYELLKAIQDGIPLSNFTGYVSLYYGRGTVRSLIRRIVNRLRGYIVIESSFVRIFDLKSRGEYVYYEDDVHEVRLSRLRRGTPWFFYSKL